MLRLVGTLVAVLMACTACTSGSDPAAEPQATAASPTEESAVSLGSVGIDWPEASGDLAPADPPASPDGFDDELLGRMGDVLTEWAQASTLDTDAELPAEIDTAWREQTKDAVSPRLAIANVFADDVTVVGPPRVTTAWRQSTEIDDAGKEYVLLELQTRAAYEVRLGDDAPTRVIGVLRVHGLSAYPDTTDDFGVSGGWQEFGATDCALALDDDLIPDGNLEAAELDLQTFVTIGAGTTVEMPSLGPEQQVDAEYLERCRSSST
ncbi:MAG: hypothetical protein ABWX74_12450 [Aeromicrobium sp.]